MTVLMTTTNLKSNVTCKVMVLITAIHLHTFENKSY